MTKKTIAVDMDGVLADIEAQFLSWYEKDFGIKRTRQDLQGTADDESFPATDVVHKFLHSKNFFLSMPVMNGAVEAINVLSQKFEIYIVSAAMEFPLSLAEKLAWLNIHFPVISWHNIIFCGDKSVIHTDYMIDDHTKNLDNFHGKTIMFSAFHNVNQHHHTRVNTWPEVIELMDKY